MRLIRNPFALAIFIALATGPLSAEEIAGKSAAATIDEHIRKLDSEDYDTREAAFNGLLKTGEAALAPLKKRLAENKTPSTEFTARAQRFIDLYEGGTVNGLRLKLEADKAKISPGDEINFTTTLYNLTDRDMNVLVARSSAEDFFRFGAALRMIRKNTDASAEDPPLFPELIKPTQHSYYYSFVKLAPKGTMKYTCKGICEESKAGDNGKAFKLVLGAYKTWMLHEFSLRSGTYYVSAEHAVTAADIIPPGNGNRAVDYTLPFWTGVIGSNRIKIQIDGAAEK